jgi:hypothetical protein
MQREPISDTLTPSDRDIVRSEVRQLLERTESFRTLPQHEQRAIANGLVQVVSFLADPAAGKKELSDVAKRVHRDDTLAAALADKQPPPKQGTGGRFDAGATTALVGAAPTVVREVDFPGFVSGLIEGVFTSIVDSSIRQMEAYSKLLEAVVTSVKDFADENIPEDDARSYLKNKFPSALTKSRTGNQSVLALKDDIDDDQMPDFKGELGLDFEPDFSDPEAEKQVVEAARLKMARMKQQHLATMVLMGINRIIVTDGKINAKVVFDFEAKDTAKSSDEFGFEQDVDVESQAAASNKPWASGRSEASKVKTTVSSSYSADVKNKSDSSLESHVKLTGEVSINFRSETFPLDRINPADMSVVQERAG